MTAEQTPDIEAAIAAVLAKHEDTTFDPAMHGRECSCGWGDDDFRRTDAEFHTHVAQALAPVLYAERVKAGAAELREAADMLDEGADLVFHQSSIAFWLRDRADRIAVDAPEGGEGR